MPKLTVKDLLDLKGIRKIAFVQVAIGNTRRTCEPEIGPVEYCNLDL